MKKYIIIGIVLIVLLGLFVLIFNQLKKSNNSSEKKSNDSSKNSSNDNAKTNEPTENYIKCKVDGKEIILTSYPLVNEFPKSGVAVVSAYDKSGENISITFPYKTTGKFENKAGELNSNQPGIHYVSKEQVSFQNNWVDKTSDYSVINIETYDSNVKGTFSGRLTRIDPSGWNNSGSVKLTDCKFSVKEFKVFN